MLNEYSQLCIKFTVIFIIFNNNIFNNKKLKNIFIVLSIYYVSIKMSITNDIYNSAIIFMSCLKSIYNEQNKDNRIPLFIHLLEFLYADKNTSIILKENPYTCDIIRENCINIIQNSTTDKPYKALSRKILNLCNLISYPQFNIYTKDYIKHIINAYIVSILTSHNSSDIQQLSINLFKFIYYNDITDLLMEDQYLCFNIYDKCYYMYSKMKLSESDRVIVYSILRKYADIHDVLRELTGLEIDSDYQLSSSL